jgi:NTE family protein
LQATGPDCPITLVELIHRKQSFEGSAKDYEFSRLSMCQHWNEGQQDVDRTLNHKDWKSRIAGQDGLQLFDLGAPETPTKGKSK